MSMKRMWSKGQFTKEVVKAVQSGALDEAVANAVDDYLEENPVDITALEGQDIAPKDINATGSITADSIIENMSGYSAVIGSDLSTWEYDIIYCGVVKNGNKLTFACCGTFKKLSTTTENSPTILNISVPASVFNKLYPVNISGYNTLDNRSIEAFDTVNSSVGINARINKASLSLGVRFDLTNLVQDTSYFIRYEVTFLLSDSLLS